MNKLVNLKSFISNQVSGDWGHEEQTVTHNVKVTCVRGADINDINLGEYSKVPVRFVNLNKSDKFLYEGDLIIEISGGSPTQSTGRVAYIRKMDNNIICSNFCRALKIKSSNSSKYFYYLLRNIYNSNIFFNFESKTNGIKNLLYDVAFENIFVPNINLNTQKQISKVLSDLDAKIEVNNQINRELEAMAKLVYDYWFVQFDFPVASSISRTSMSSATAKKGTEVLEVPYKSSGGKMVYNEALKREIPEGWEVKELDKFAEIKRGNLITEKTANVNGKIKVVSAGIDYSYFHDEYNREAFTISISGSGANAGFINFWREPIFANDCTTVRGKNDFETFIIHQFLLVRQEYIFNQARGSAQPHVYPKDIAVLQISIPSSNLINEYGKIVNPINHQIAVNNKQNQQLAALRDWLLPMLMNGQVSVGKAYKEGSEEMGMAAEGGEGYKINNKS